MIGESLYPSQLTHQRKDLGSPFCKTKNLLPSPAKSICDKETHFGDISCKLLADVFAVLKFHTCVYSRTFVVEPDLKPVEMVHLKNIISTPPHLQRMLFKIIAL